MEKIVVLINDLFLGSKIRETLKALSKEARFLSSGQGLSEAVGADSGGLVLVDLSLRGEDPIAAVAALRQTPHPGLRVIGFVSHVDTATAQRAREAGFDAVMPRSQFFAGLADLVGSA
jgi:CheY-like chemotaxis protein